MKKLIYFFLLAAGMAAPMSVNATRGVKVGLQLSERGGTISQEMVSIEHNPVQEAPLKAVGDYTDPQGTRQFYNRSGNAIVTSWGKTYTTSYQNQASEIIFGDDTDVYLVNPIYGYVTASYIKGTREGNKVTFEFPQLVGHDINVGDLYVYRMIPTEDAEDMWFGYVPDTSNQTITFEIDEDGFVIEEESTYKDEKDTYPDFMIGLTNDLGQFTGMGDWNLWFEPNGQTVVSIPENVELQPYVLSCTWDIYMLSIGQDDEDIYIKGLYNKMPDAAIKGHIKDNKIEIPSGQFLGYDPEMNRWKYVLALDSETFSILDTINCEYDEATQTISGEQTIGLSTSPTFFSWSYIIYGWTMKYQPVDATLSDPKNPNILLVDYNDSETLAIFDLYPLDIQGYYLNPDHLYYRVFVDGDLYTFEPDEYGLTESTTLIPATLDDDVNFDVAGTMTTVKIILGGLTTIGIQAVYINGNEELKSEIVTYDITSVDTLAEVKEIKGVEYFNLQGQKISKPDNGIFIKMTQYTDGSRKCEKIGI